MCSCLCYLSLTISNSSKPRLPTSLTFLPVPIGPIVSVAMLYSHQLVLWEYCVS